VSVDVVLYVDRLDLYRVEPLDKRVRDTHVTHATDSHITSGVV